VIILYGTVKNKYQQIFSLNASSGVIGDQLNVPYIMPQRLTGDSYANVMQDEPPAVLENVLLQTRRQMCYQHDGAPLHFSQVVRLYVNYKFPNRWIGRGGT
jgi:hypothetical protein